jgi:hypothetical protein
LRQLRQEVVVLPRLVLRVRRAVGRRVQDGARKSSMDGSEIVARWQRMLMIADLERYEAERRLTRAEDALNRLNLQ